MVFWCSDNNLIRRNLVVNIDYTSYRSENFNDRIRFLVLHYTAQNFADSIKSLTNGSVSAHYLVPDETDKTYTDRFKDKIIGVFNLVDEDKRAWHAGMSYWAGRNNLNDTSIGIEIVNQATDNQGVFTFPPFTEKQVELIKSLSSDILNRNPDISPTQVLGHSDIAPGRKSDPGAAFPWKELYDAGIGAWYNEQSKQEYVDKFTSDGLPVQEDIINKLKCYGYDVSNALTKQGFAQLIRAFQLHFRPENYDGVLDIGTAAILYALVDKYFPEK